MRVIAIIPAWNEGNVLFRTVSDINYSGPWDVLIVDDGSTDHIANSCRIWLDAHLIRLASHHGVGAAIRTGLWYAKHEHYDIAVIVNAKGKTPAYCIPRLVRAIEEGADIAQGSRYLGHGINTPWHRRFGHWLHSRPFSLRAGCRITDSTCGFRAISLSMLQDSGFKLDQPWLDGYSLEPYLLLKAIQLGYEVREVPVDIIYPKTGKKSSMKLKDWWTISRPLWRRFK